MSYLKIENMEIAFNSIKGKFVAVRDINLDVEKGQIISIIGHSGLWKVHHHECNRRNGFSFERQRRIQWKRNKRSRT